jgi:hypothetical protein
MKKFFFIWATAALIVIGCQSRHEASHRSEFPVRYHNQLYGLTFRLPASWQGFTVLTQQWEGISYIPTKDITEVTEQGPLIVLRHPRWTARDPYQDIPIFVFTRNQWESDKLGRFAIGAGGFDEEIGHNSKFVFAISSRFNGDDSLNGWREASDAVERNRAAMPHLYPE